MVVLLYIGTRVYLSISISWFNVTKEWLDLCNLCIFYRCRHVASVPEEQTAAGTGVIFLQAKLPLLVTILYRIGISIHINESRSKYFHRGGCWRVAGRPHGGPHRRKLGCPGDCFRTASGAGRK